MTVLSACSASLTALVTACRAIDSGDCDAALVGGASLQLPNPSGYIWLPGSPFSKTGIVSPFDAAADGMVPVEETSLAPGRHLMGVTGLGMGGTNVHIVVSGQQSGRRDDDGFRILPLAADREDDLLQLVRSLRDHLLEAPFSLADISTTLVSRVSVDAPWRACFRATNRAALVSALDDWMADPMAGRTVEGCESVQDWLTTGDRTSLIATVAVDGHRVPLPVLTLRGERCWLEVAPAVRENTGTTRGDHSNLLDQVLNLFSQQVGTPVGADDTFVSLGLDSFTTLMLASDLTDLLGCEIPSHRLEGDVTPRSLVEQVSNDDVSGSFAVCLHDACSSTDLFLIHPAGGSIECYRDLLRGLDLPVNVYGIPYGGSSAMMTVQDLAPLYAEVVVATSQGRCVLLGGYSFGGNEAVAVADELRRRNVMVSDILMIDSIVPEAYRSGSLTQDEYVAKLPQILEVALGKSRGDLHEGGQYESVTASTTPSTCSPTAPTSTHAATTPTDAYAIKLSSPRSTSTKTTNSALKNNRPFEMLLDPEINANALTWA